MNNSISLALRFYFTSLLVLATLNWNCTNLDDLLANNSDESITASIIIEESDNNSSVTEGGSGDTYSIVLKSKPEQPVSITLNNKDNQLKISPELLSFHPDNWNIKQTISIEALDDQDHEQLHDTTIEHKIVAGDTDYRLLTLPQVYVSIQDNDGANVLASKVNLIVSEDGQYDEYSLTLTSAPSGTVTINVMTDLAQVSIFPTSLTFTSENWSIPQTVRITAIDDNHSEALHPDINITHQVTSSDTGYNGLAISDITTSITDNDYIIYVKEGASGDGSSWGAAYGDLQEALTNAIQGQEIWIAQGTYYPHATEREVSFTLKNNISLYGGFVGAETSKNQRDWQSNKTILSGDINISGDDSDNSYNVIEADNVSNITVDGFYIEKGNANSYYKGAGMSVTNVSQLFLKNLYFKNNSADNNGTGGGLYVTNSPAAEFDSLIFDSNSCQHHGGGFSLWYSSDSTIKATVFKENSATLGGGLAIVGSSDVHVIDNSSFENNLAASQGGGAYLFGGSGTKIDNSTFKQNTADIQGGGFYSASDLTIGNNTNFESNIANGGSASDGGGAIFATAKLTIDGATFTSNTVARYGAGIVLNGVGASGSTIKNTTFQGNMAGIGGGLAVVASQGVEVIDSSFTNNTASLTDGGGGIHFHSSTDGDVIGSTLTGNNATGGKGGGMSVYYGSDKLTITDSIFTDNTASSNGGGISVWSSSDELTITDSIFTGNETTGGNGGGLNADESHDLTVTTAVFSGNASNDSGGGLHVVDSNDLTVTASIFSENTATLGHGGGISTSNSDGVTVGLSIFVSNSAEVHGGGIFHFGTDGVITDSTFYDNESMGSTGLGGGLFNNSGSNELLNSVFYNNTSYNGTITDVENYNATSFTIVDTQDLIAIPDDDPFYWIDGDPDDIWTPLLATGASSIDLVSSSPYATDFFGNDRIYGPLPDSGAIEFNNIMVDQTAIPEAITEGSSIDYDVSLATIPAGTVTITITSEDDSQASVSPTTLTFTAANEPQTVTVTALDDSTKEVGYSKIKLTHSASGGGVDYNDITSNKWISIEE